MITVADVAPTRYLRLLTRHIDQQSRSERDINISNPGSDRLGL